MPEVGRRLARIEIALIPLALATFLSAWEFLVRWQGYPTFILPSPATVWARFIALLLDGRLLLHTTATVAEVLAGLALGLTAALLIGYGLAKSPLLERILSPYIVASQAIPIVALAPLLVIWFGFGTESKIALGAMVVFFIIFFNVFSGVRSVEPALVNSIRTMGGTNRDVTRLVILPTTYAWVFAAMKTSISMALVSAVVGEFVGSTAGVGWIMTQASGVNNTTRLFSTMIVLALVGAILFEVVRRVEDRILGWRANLEF
jgi:NitT/TauT family transport system permease protein